MLISKNKASDTLVATDWLLTKFVAEEIKVKTNRRKKNTFS